MSLSPRQLATLGFVTVCILVAAIVCLFAPLRFALLAMLFVLGGCVLAILVFLRKVLTAVYQLRDAIDSGEVTFRSPTDVTSRLDRIEQHLPERITSRVIFELARENRSSSNLTDPSNSDR